MRKNKIDFKSINDAALRQSLRVAMQYAPGGKKQGKEWVALCPSRIDKTARSFSLDLNTGVWADFGADCKGADLISYVAYCTGQKQGEAAIDLARYLNIDHGAPAPASTTKPKPAPSPPVSDFTPVFPPPIEAAASCPTRHYKHGEAGHHWDYLGLDRQTLLMRVCRFDLVEPDGSRRKTYAPLAYGMRTHKGKPQMGWHWRQLPGQRPLYGLETLGDARRIVLAEGEKACDASRLLFPSIPGLTWSSGVKAMEKTDFSPLAGLDVWYWPDDDAPGRASVAPLTDILAKVGALSLNVLDVSLFAKYQPQPLGSDPLLLEAKVDWQDGHDAHDAWQLGWRPEHIAALESMGSWQPISLGSSSTEPAATAEPVVAIAAPTNTTTPAAAPAPLSSGGFRVDTKGVYFFDRQSESYRRACAPIRVIAMSRRGDDSGLGWGILVEFRDLDGRQKQWNIPRHLFAVDGGREIKCGLLDRGLDIDVHRDAVKKMLEFIQVEARCVPSRVTLVNKMGWFKKTAFVLPDRTLGQTLEPVILEGGAQRLCKVAEKGTLAQWRDQISVFCVGSPLAIFAVSTAFAAPLVDLISEETFGVHFHGDSSLGKSSLLNLACSVVGKPADYKRSWRSTDNALEASAAAHSDMLLALDEISQVDSRLVYSMVYMLGNSNGKDRANDKGGAGDAVHRWQLAFLSNGEKTLSQHLGEAGKELTGGLEMRFLEIPASLHEDEKTKKQMGVFNNCHGLESGAALSDHFKTATAEHHGTAFPAFLQALINARGKDDGKELVIKIRQGIKKFKIRHLRDRGGQVDRAANKFALIGLAGELASAWDITGWPKGAALEAAGELFRRWLVARGGSGNLEEAQILRHLQGVFQKNAERNFKRWDRKNNGVESTVIDEHVPAVVELWGFRSSRVIGNTPNNYASSYQKAKNGEAPDYESAATGEYSEIDFLVPDLSFRENVCKGIDHKRAARLLDRIGALEVPPSLRIEGKLYSRLVLPGMGQKKMPCYKINYSKLMAAEEEAQEGVNGSDEILPGF